MILVGVQGGRCTTSSSEQVRPSENTMRPSLNSAQYSLPSLTTCRTSLRGPSRTLIRPPPPSATHVGAHALHGRGHAPPPLPRPSRTLTRPSPPSAPHVGAQPLHGGRPRPVVDAIETVIVHRAA